MRSDSLSLEFAAKTHKAVFEDLRSSPSGLTSQEAQERVQKEGMNAIEGEHVGWWTIFVRQFSSSFIYLLLVAAGVTFLLGEYIDALFIFLFVALNTALGFFQEYRSEQTLRYLRDYTLPTARVRRDGQEKSV